MSFEPKYLTWDEIPVKTRNGLRSRLLFICESCGEHDMCPIIEELFYHLDRLAILLEKHTLAETAGEASQMERF